uniref:Uncharacterized protein n=1 Tax=Tanacetum cinerariifolium TaxID=118510 RepID=A0A6L2KLF4_TANCI|nr:hypothetical protein [Tanacetum cinerariifolium]
MLKKTKPVLGTDIMKVSCKPLHWSGVKSAQVRPSRMVFGAAVSKAFDTTVKGCLALRERLIHPDIVAEFEPDEESVRL